MLEEPKCPSRLQPVLDSATQLQLQVELVNDDEESASDLRPTHAMITVDPFFHRFTSSGPLGFPAFLDELLFLDDQSATHRLSGMVWR